MGKWEDLSIRDKAGLIKIYVSGGVVDLSSMKRHYNSFAEGGPKDKDKDKYIDESDPEFIGPVVPSSVSVSNTMKDASDRNNIKGLVKKAKDAANNAGKTAKEIIANGRANVNKFVDGGPESRHHNGRDYTLDEYKDEKRNEIIDAAYRKSLSRTEPKVPMVTVRPADEAAGYEKESKRLFDIASKYVNKGAVFNKVVDEFGEVGAVATNPLMYKDKDEFDYYARLASEYLDMAGFKQKEKPFQIPGPSCIATATDNYGDRYYVSGNQTFKANPGKYGFVEIPISELKRGDLVQSIANGIPVHAMIFDGYNDDGNLLFNYSNGGSDPESVRKHSAYFPKGAFDKNFAKAYRFVGNSDDNERWEREYNELNNQNACGGFLRKYEEGGPEGEVGIMLDPSGYLYKYDKHTLPPEMYNTIPLKNPNPEKYSDDEGIAGFYNINDQVVNGSARLYKEVSDHFKYLNDTELKKSNHSLYDSLVNSYKFYKNNDTGEIFGKRRYADPYLNLDNYTEISYDDVRKMMPKRDYIGGKGYRLNAAKRIPGFIEKISDRARAYGINPNLLLHRILKEGFIDQQVKDYNLADSTLQNGFWQKLWDNEYSGFGSFGLDDAGSNLLSGKYSLIDPSVSWSEQEATNEKGRPVTSVYGDLKAMIEIKAAEMAYRQNELAKRGIIGDAYTNAAYNGGLNWSRLSDADYITSNYSVPDYGVFGKGGKIHIKESKKGTFTAAANNQNAYGGLLTQRKRRR